MSLYLIAYHDADGQRQEVNAKTPDRDAAQQLANHLETQAMKRRTGQSDAKAERYAKEARRPVGEHAADFRDYLTAKQRDARYVALTDMHIKTVVEACKAQHIGDLTGAAVMQAVA